MVSVLKAARLALGVLAIVAIASCSVSSAGRNSGRDRVASPRTGEGHEIVLATLESQPLNPGQCGLYLWGASEQQPSLVLVAYDQPSEAHLSPNGRDRVMARTEFSGERTSGHFEHQVFSDGRLTVTVDVEFDSNRPLQDGAVVRRGSIRIRDAEGWETLTPAGGMAACAAR